ncbi:glycosyltransferase, partial [Patescibacteria group bacterium]|nr:glycosyltransferase [Patescibacteria group bacterium]MBU1663382.1 glycosyltransferase [Patescibacteria group bacterium]MBU1934329.1 glycosyltransferase [Patescibacteria group bacterium]MBU2007624.1 glycosyltransferase [Patescibacteria group bacterium]MBU2233367.1 glycosyltransferase [Patescibacteria group bacterium]
MDNKQNINKIKRIGIDARLYGRISKGLGRYTQEVVDNIIKLDQDNKYVIFLCQENFNDFQCDDIRVKKILTDIKWYGLAEQIVMPYYIWRERLDLMHFPHFNVPIFCPVKFIVTIHDLILIKFSTPRATTLGPLVYKIKNFFYKIVISMAVKRAKKILTVSEYTKNDIVERFKVNSKKIVVTYEGVAELTSMTHSDLLGTVAECHIRHKFPNFGKFLSKISSLIYPYSLKNFIKNFLEIMKISIR